MTTREDWYGRTWPDGTDTCPTCGQPDNCGDCTHTRLHSSEARELGAVTGAERFTWNGWHEGIDCEPQEPGKEWLAILDDGEEYATIMLRTDASVFRLNPLMLNAARATRELRAQNIVRALNEMNDREEVLP